MQTRYEDDDRLLQGGKLEEIREHNHVLTPGRYVGATAAEADDVPFEERFAELKETLAEQFAEAEELSAFIQKKAGGGRYAWVSGEKCNLVMWTRVSLDYGAHRSSDGNNGWPNIVYGAPYPGLLSGRIKALELAYNDVPYSSVSRKMAWKSSRLWPDGTL